MGARGQSRNSKKPRPSRAKKPSVEARAEILLEKAIEYLETEYDIYAASPGNHQEIIRIAKALAAFTGQMGKEDRPTGPSAKDSFIATFMAR